MLIGSLQLKSNLFLSPLAGYTNLPFRLTVREIGGMDLATTDLVNARSLLEKNRKALKLIETRPADQPLAVQLFGSVPEEMRDAAAYLESIGVAAVDINMGCPVRKVCRVGGGSAMMTELEQDGATGARHGRGGENTRDGENAAGLGRAEFDRAGPGASAGRGGRGGHFCAWPHAPAGLRRHGQPGGHRAPWCGRCAGFPSSATAT